MLAAGILCSGRAAALDLYVSADGHDAWSGRLAASDAGGKDGPFASLERARDEIRRLKREKSLLESVTVHVRSGTYFLDRTFELFSEDSGTAAAPIVYLGDGPARPLLVGGKLVTGFTPYKDKILVADVASQGLKGVAFRQLFFDGRRQILARYPNFDPKNPYAGGWAYVEGEPVDLYRDRPEDSGRLLHFKAEDARAISRPEEAEVFIFARFNWWNDIRRIASIDRENRVITLAGDCSYAIRPGDRYYIQGLFEELDSPGEWYLDKAAGKLYFWPPTPLEAKTVFAPTLRTIIQIGDGVSDVTFRGFDIKCCEGNAVALSKATNCLITGCVIRNVGDYNGSAVVIVEGSGNGVAGCDISEVGRDGVYISGGDRKTLRAAGNYADNNYIHHVGVFYKQGVGISLEGVGNRASHNLIHDGPRMGILFSGNNLLIEYNHIRHMNLETEDTGAVYTGGCDWISSRGTVIRYNYFHDMLGFGRKDGKWAMPYFAWGVYLDDNAGGVDVIGNIVARCARAGLHLHNGRDNLIENNIFLDNGLCQAEYNGWKQDSQMWKDHFPTMVKGFEMVAGEPAWQNMRNMKTHPKDAILPDGLIMSGNTLSRNIFCYRDPPAQLYRFSNVSFEHNAADYNLIWHYGLPIVSGQFDGLQALQAVGLDRNSLVADPLFVAPEKDDWRLRPDSPAFKLGFQPIPVDKIGPYPDRLRASWPITEAPGAREWLERDKAR